MHNDKVGCAFEQGRGTCPIVGQHRQEPLPGQCVRLDHGHAHGAGEALGLHETGAPLVEPAHQRQSDALVEHGNRPEARGARQAQRDRAAQVEEPLDVAVPHHDVDGPDARRVLVVGHSGPPARSGMILSNQQPPRHPVRVAGLQPQPRGSQRQPPVAPDLHVVEIIQPSAQPVGPTRGDARGHTGPHQRARALEVAPFLGVPDRGVEVAVGLEPPGRPQVQAHGQPRLLALQVGTQGVGEQVVVAVPVASRVGGHDELHPIGQAAQHRRGVVALQHGIAQGSLELVEDGGAPQEVPRVVGVAGQDLSTQVVHNEPIRAADARCQAIDAPTTSRLDRQHHQVEPHGPALGAPGQVGDLGLREPGDHGLHQAGALVVVEREVLGPQVEDAALCTHPGHPGRGGHPAQQHHLRPGRNPVGERGQESVAVRARQQVDVVDHEDVGTSSRGGQLGEGRQQQGGEVRLDPGGQRLELTRGGTERPQCLDQAHGQGGRVVQERRDAHDRMRPGVLCGPLQRRNCSCRIPAPACTTTTGRSRFASTWDSRARRGTTTIARVCPLPWNTRGS